MLRTCFVARLVGDTNRTVDIFCRFEPPVNAQAKLPDLPSAQNLGTFCFPTGPDKVKAREYGAPEVCLDLLCCDLSCLSLELEQVWWAGVLRTELLVQTCCTL